MATILLSAAGAAIGSGVGGSVLGLSGAVIGRAIGATVGRSLDQRLLGAGSDAVEVGRVENFRITGASYGAPIKEVWGRMRIPGQVIWASRFSEHVQTSGGGGKGAPGPTNSTTTFSYSVSLAIALCKGEALGIGRVWANGIEIASRSLDLRFYPGSETQLPDPKIVAVEGSEDAPAYRGICYVVIEDLDLTRFGNRVPQFSFEVIRNADRVAAGVSQDFSDVVKAVAMIPGTGEYSLATTPVHFALAPGKNVSANVHTVQGITDFDASLAQLEGELPNCSAVSLVVSWFGNDLRCAHCTIRPKVEQAELDASNMQWSVSGLGRATAQVVPQVSGRPIYGGTPTDQSVVEAIQKLKSSGKEVMFYPFILMDQLENNTLPDPWSDSASQPALPWRGRITLEKAPGVAGSSDQTPAAQVEVDDFLGNADPSDFQVNGASVLYTGPEDWGYRRFILHYAKLCAAAGGVDTFCIGSELRSLTQIRSGSATFPMVVALKQLASEAKAILGPGTKVTYAADWSEYFGLRTGSDVLFHLDPLWADANIDFIGIDNYMPISDWRGEHAILEGGESVYDLTALEFNVGRGEGYDWYYENAEATEIGRRSSIVDTAYGEDWVFRYKDIKSWWENEHFNRIAGVRQPSPTSWIPGSKPIRFTELGCPAVDRGTNEPNKFIDERSSESSLPLGSTGEADEYIQLQYLLATDRFWRNPANNPISAIYGQEMVDVDRSHVWAWDARPYPEFPGNLSVWSDGGNYHLGHWLNGRSSNQPLSTVVADIMTDCGVEADVSDLHGIVRGFEADSNATARSKLQTLMTAFDFQIIESEGVLSARNSAGLPGFDVSADELVDDPATTGSELRRGVRAEAAERVRVSYYSAGGDFESATSESTLPMEGEGRVSESDLTLLLHAEEANAIAERSLNRAWLGRDQMTLRLGPSRAEIQPGSKIKLDGAAYRVLSVESADARLIEAVRVDDLAALRVKGHGTRLPRQSPAVATPVSAVFLDLPLLRGVEVPHAPYIAVAASPWPGTVAVWSASTGASFTLNALVDAPTIIGTTTTPLQRFRSDLWDRGSRLTVQIGQGALLSVSEDEVMNGANLVAIGPSPSGEFELIQFATATLVGEGTYELSNLLRGVAGSDALAPATHLPGSGVVVFGPGVRQIDLPIGLIGLNRDYKIGPADLGYADPNVVTTTEIFGGVGLRPYSVCHLRGKGEQSGDFTFTWTRRTRIGGDNWELQEVALGEESESYQVRVRVGALAVRDVVVTTPTWTYSAAMAAQDGVTGAFLVDVSQRSNVFGSGPMSTIAMTT